MIEVIDISDDLTIRRFYGKVGHGALEIYSADGKSTVGVLSNELAALITSLNQTAKEIGIPTTAAKYRALCAEILDDLEGEEIDMGDRWENWRRVLRANLEEDNKSGIVEMPQRKCYHGTQAD